MQTLSDSQFQYKSNQINSIHALPHGLIDRRVKRWDELTFRQLQDMWLSMRLFDVILLWRHNCAPIWRAIWLWRHYEKVCQQVRCRAFGDQAIGC